MLGLGAELAKARLLGKLIDGDVVGRLLALGLAQLMGEAETASVLYRGLLADFPDWAVVMVNLSELLGAGEETREEAVQMASRAADLTPRWQVARWNLAQRAMEAGDPDRARQAARQVLEISPDHADARALLAELDQPAQR